MDSVMVEEPLTSPDKSQDGKCKDNTEDLEVDNSKSVLLKIATLYAEQLMSDLTLEVAGSWYPAHRLILCASSEVFQVMLMNREWSEWRRSHIVLQETPAAGAVFPHFLKYFYTGQIRMSHQNVLPVLTLADKYNVRDLVTLCLRYMSENIAQAANRHLLIAWMQYTMACGHDEVAKLCQDFVKWNIEWCWADAELGALEADTLLLLLRHSDVVAHNEMSLFRFVERWLNQQRVKFDESDLDDIDKSIHWNTLVTTMFSHVRFPMMCPAQLAKVVRCSWAQQHKHFFMERMSIAMSYQSDQIARVAQVAHGSGEQFTPRLYTEDTWGTLLSVERFHALPSYHTRTFIFSSRATLSARYQDCLSEWTVDLYPKGVWFRKSLLINWTGNYDVPEVVLRTVRLSITCHSCPEPGPPHYDDDSHDIRVKIGILVWGVQKDVEHITTVIERVHRFSSNNRVLNVDNALDFDELNTPLYSPGDSLHSAPHKRCCSKCTDDCENPAPRHLLGPNRDQLKIQVVIVPLTKFCRIGAPDPAG